MNGCASVKSLIPILCVSLLLGIVDRLPAQEHPLEPLDIASPRATLQSLVSQARKLDTIQVEYWRQPTEKNYHRALAELAKTRRLFDLRDVPPANRNEVGGASFAYLYDIVIRLPELDWEKVPDRAEADAQKLTIWRYPGTELILQRVEKGDRKGGWLVSSETVARLPEFHRQIIDQPALRPAAVTNWYDVVVRTCGPWFAFAMADRLPEPLQLLIFGTPLWKVLVTLLAAAIIAALLTFWIRLTRRKPEQTAVASLALRLTRPLVFLGLVYLAHRHLIEWQLNLAGAFAVGENIVAAALFFLALAWAAFLLIFLLVELIISSPQIPAESYDAHLLRLLARVLATVASLGILLAGANYIGIPALGLLAGLGVGGVAVALAAQGTVENLLGGLNIFADRPFRVGDLIHYDAKVGVVEAIGPRSCRLRGLDGTLTTVPNGDLAKMHVTNYSMRNKCFFHHVLSIRYETTPGQCEWLLEAMRRRLAAHPMVEESPGMPRVRLTGFGNSSIEIELRAYVLTTNFSEFLEVQELLLLDLLKLVEEAGTALALPSSTTYLSRDHALNEEKAREAELRAREQPRASSGHREGPDGPDDEGEDDR